MSSTTPVRTVYREMSDVLLLRHACPRLRITIFVAYEHYDRDADSKTYTNYPANGGCRVKFYVTDNEAAEECHSLASLMSLKHKTFQTGFAGGKIVVRCSALKDLNRNLLMTELCTVLRQFEGRFLTGCDMNTTLDDMKRLADITSWGKNSNGYVLAGIDTRNNPNEATAYGVFAAVQELSVFLNRRSKNLKVLVLGTGKVGSHVANLLLRMTKFEVLVADLREGHAACAVPDATDVSGRDWSTIQFDVLVPCAASHVIDSRSATQMKCKAICGSTNIPIADAETERILEDRKILFVPEAISSAGAVIQDSIEHYEPTQFCQVHPSYIYAFVSSLVERKTRQFLQEMQKQPDVNPYTVLRSVNEMETDSKPVGTKFSSWLSRRTSNFDVAIIGAGMAGTACAYNLAKSGFAESVALIEQIDIANTLGSSNGDSRMYREMYSDPFYSKLMSDSLVMWSELEERTGTKLLTRNSLLFFGSSCTGETSEGSIPGAINTLKSLGIDHEVFGSNTELHTRFKDLRPNDDDVGVLSVGDGSINASAACKAMATYAQEEGVTMWENVTVLNIFTNDIGSSKALLLLSDWRVIQVKSKLVLSPGGWTNRILKEQFNLDIDSEVQMVAWGHFELPEDAAEMPQWFCFRSESHTKLSMGRNQHGLYYGFPSVHVNHRGKRTRAVKVGTDFTPDCAYSGCSVPVSQRNVHRELRDDIHSFLRSHWPKIGEEISMQYSPYHVTPSQDFVLGPLPGFPDVVLFCGGSGRAFKFAPLIGACLSSLVQGKKPNVDISRFDPRKVINTSTTAEEGGDGDSKKRSAESALGKSHVPFGRRGQGVYSLATQGCFDVMNTFESDVLTALEKAISPRPGAEASERPLVLCDFGAADGGTSLGLWTKVIQRCKQAAPHREIEMKYEDQPNADYQSLFHYTQGLLRVAGRTGKTYLEEKFGEKVFVSAVGTSFYKQCVPSCSLSFGYSATAMHWLSQTPELGLPSGVLHHTQLKKGDAALAAWAKRAAEDWELLLVARAAELHSGGAMVIVSLGVDENGQWLGHTKGVARSMFDEMSRQWRAMMEDGHISEEEYDRTEIINYYRSAEEMTSLFEDKSSRVYRAGLRLEAVKTRVTPCCYRAKWLRERDDVQAYATGLALSMRTWSNSSFKAGLDGTRSDEEKERITDELFGRITDAIAEAPDEYGMDYVHVMICVRKE